MATFNQVMMLAKMCDERGLPAQPIHDEQNAGTLDNKRVQALFKILKTKPKLQEIAATTPVTAETFKPMALTKKNVAAAEGGYQVGDQIYKVKRSSSGYNYAMLLDGKTAKGKPNWVIAKGFVFKLTEADRMTADQVKAFGDLYHHCIFCGLELTRPESIDRGCGWKCASKHGLL